MGDFFSFRRMITPIIIKIVFWFGVVVTVVAGLGFLADGNRGLGLALLVLGPLSVRIYCELLILFFRMNETLTDIRNSLAVNASSPQRPVAVAGPVPRTQVLQPAPTGTTSAISAPRHDLEQDTSASAAVQDVTTVPRS